jgi:ketosteroid isomerase-like protein
MTTENGRHFAEEWTAAWNAHDLDRVLAHYSDDFEMTSPFIVKVMDEPSGTLKGKEKVGTYWKRALERMADLHFEVLDVFVGVNSVVVHYKAVLGLLACEVFLFNAEGKVYKGLAHYNRV